MRFVEDVSQETISMLQRIYTQSKHRVRQRAQCLLLSYHGSTPTQLMKIFQVDRITMYPWFNAWETRHLPDYMTKPNKDVRRNVLQSKKNLCVSGRKPSLRM